MSNPFSTVEWETTDPNAVGDILPAGEHLVTIDSIDGTETSSGGHPQLVVKASNDDGTITDWLVVIPAAMFRPAALFAACGLEKPEEEEVAEDGTGFRIDPKYLDKCVGKKVGVIVRDEQDRNDPTKIRQKVKGWCKAEELPDLKTDVPADTSGFDPTPSASSSDLPF